MVPSTTTTPTGPTHASLVLDAAGEPTPAIGFVAVDDGIPGTPRRTRATPETPPPVRFGLGLERGQVGTVAGVCAHRARQALAHQHLVDRDAVLRIGIEEATAALVEGVAGVFLQEDPAASKLAIARARLLTAWLVGWRRFRAEVAHKRAVAPHVCVERVPGHRARDLALGHQRAIGDGQGRRPWRRVGSLLGNYGGAAAHHEHGNEGIEGSEAIGGHHTHQTQPRYGERAGTKLDPVYRTARRRTR